jgi:hypothetical protein
MGRSAVGLGDSGGDGSEMEFDAWLGQEERQKTSNQAVDGLAGSETTMVARSVVSCNETASDSADVGGLPATFVHSIVGD